VESNSSKEAGWLSLVPRFARKHLHGRHELQLVLGNTAWLIFDRALRMVVAFAIGIWLARYLGPDQYGVFNYAIAFVALFGVIANLALEGLAIRDLVRNPGAKDEILGTLFLLRLGGGLIAWALALCTLLVLRPGQPLLAWLVAILAAAPLFQAFDVIDYWFQARVASKYSVYARGAAFFVVSVAKVVLILAKVPLVAFAWTVMAEAVLGGIGLLYTYRATGQHVRHWRMTARCAMSLLVEGWPALVSGFLILVYMRIAQVMLGEMASFADVGSYSVAIRLVEVWYIVPVTLTASLFPAIIRSKEMGPVEYRGRIQHLYDLVLWMAIIVAVPVSFLAPWIVNLLFGPGYAAAGPVLSLQCWMATWVFFGVARAKWLYAEGALKQAMAVEVMSALINIAANVLLIPAYGAVGASVASLIAAFCANFVVAVFSRVIRQSMAMYFTALAAPVRYLGARSW